MKDFTLNQLMNNSHDPFAETPAPCVPRGATSYACACRNRNHDESCIFYKRDALIAAMQTAIQTLPSYEEHEFVDGDKCDVQFVKEMLQRAIDKNRRLVA